MQTPRLTTIHLLRKPLAGTVAANALKYGTGSLNIDGTRLGGGERPLIQPDRRRFTGNTWQGGLDGSLCGSRNAGTTTQGRWPANVILQHSESCQLLGHHYEEFLINVYSDATRGNYAFYKEEGDDDDAPGYVSEGRGQMVEDWSCVAGCPVADLDEQVPGKGGVGIYYKQVAHDYDLIEYLRTMISTPDRVAVVVNMDHTLTDIDQWEDESCCGLVVYGTVRPEHVSGFLRLLPPGGHLMLIAPDTQPTGHRGAILLEDGGFEIRDAILWVRGPGRVHYVAKAARKEREAGCAHLPAKKGHEAVDRKEGTAGVKNPRAGAGRTAKEVRNHHPCLHPEALVFTERGFRQIQTIEKGDRVYTAAGTFQPVTWTTRHPYTSDCLYKIAVQGTNLTTLATDNHPFLIWRPKREGNRIVGGEVLWLSADQVTKGDYTMSPVPVPDVSSAEVSSDPEFWFVFGLWLAEGVIQSSGHGENGYPSFSLHVDETHLVDRIRTFAASVNVRIYDKGGNGIQVMAFDPSIGADFLRLGRKGAASKSIDPVVWTLNLECRKALFDGYMAGDGGRVRTYLQAKSVSSDLASQMWLLGESLGYKANLFWFDAQPGKIGDRVFKTTMPHYQMQFYNRDMGQTTRKPTRPTRLEHGGVIYTLRYVQGVEKVPYQGDVVNLSVEGSPTFQTVVGMSHNTVKPIQIMERLLADVPKTEPVLDPFTGSGTTGIACTKTGHSFIGIEREPEFLAIADARVRHWDRAHQGWRGATITSDHKPEQTPTKTLSLDDLFG